MRTPEPVSTLLVLPSRRRRRSSDLPWVKRYAALLLVVTLAASATTTPTENSIILLAHAHSGNPDETSSTTTAVSRSKGTNHQATYKFGLRPKTSISNPTLVFEPNPTTLSERYSSLLNSRGTANSSLEDGESTDFLKRLRAAEELERRALEQSMLGATQQQNCHARPTFFLPEWARQSLKSSALLFLATIFVELDWGRLLSDVNQASSVFLSIAWLPLLWIRPGGRTGETNGPALETLVVYLLAVLRPTFLVHVWNDVLLPHTIPTLYQMVVREGWTLLWKVFLMPVMPQLPKNSTGWAAIHVFVLQAIHKGTMKLFTSNIQRHLHSSIVRVGQKSIQLVQDLWWRT